MKYKLQFKTKDAMWDFTDEHIHNNYTANNVLKTLTLDSEYHPKDEILDIAKEFEGEEISIT
jgi:hypothetical protein